MAEDKLLSQELKEQLAQLSAPNIAVIGRSGVGKSALINAVFGFDTSSEKAKVAAGHPVTKEFQRYPKENSDNPLPLVIYDSPGYEVAEAQEFVEKVLNFLEDKQKKGFEKQIHLVWYVINAASARVEKFEQDVINKINEKNIPVIIVLSQCNRASDEEILGVENALKDYKFDKVYDVIKTAAIPLIIRGQVINGAFGLQELVALTHKKLPEACTEAFIISQIVDVEAKRKAAWQAIYTAATACFTGSFIPIPGSSPTTIIASQAGLFIRLAYIYGYKEDAQFLLTVLTPTVSSVGVLLSSSIGDLIATFFPPALAVVAAGAASYIVVFGLTCTAVFEKMAKDNIYGEGQDVKKYIEENFRIEFEKYQEIKLRSPEDLKNIEITFLNPSK